MSAKHCLLCYWLGHKLAFHDSDIHLGQGFTESENFSPPVSPQQLDGGDGSDAFSSKFFSLFSYDPFGVGKKLLALTLECFMECKLLNSHTLLTIPSYPLTPYPPAFLVSPLPHYWLPIAVRCTQLV